MEYVCHRYTYIIAFLVHTILLCIHIIYELEECSLSSLISLVNACTLKDLCEYIADLILKYLVYVVCIYVVLSNESLYPVVMLCYILMSIDVSTCHKKLCHLFNLAHASCRKDRKSHHLDESDVLLLDVVILLPWMIETKWMLLCGDVVTND